MNKNIKMTQLMGLVIVSISILVGCGNSTFNKAVEQGRLAVASKDYDKAQGSFELALEEKQDEEVQSMLDQTTNMLEGLKAMNNSDIEKAMTHFDKVISVGGPFEAMEREAKEEIDKIEVIQGQIIQCDMDLLKAQDLIKQKDYGEGKKILNQIIEQTKDDAIFEAHHKKANNMIEGIHTVVAEIERQKQEEIERQAQEQKKKEASLPKITNEEIINKIVGAQDRAVRLVGSIDYSKMDPDGHDTHGPLKEEFNTYQKAENFLTAYWSQSNAKDFLKQYTIDKNGWLYIVNGDVGLLLDYNRATIVEKVESEKSVKVKVRTPLEYEDDYSTQSFTLVYESGNWAIKEGSFF